MAQWPLSLSSNLHHLPKHQKKMLTKYDLDGKVNFEDHIDDFYLHIRMLEVQYDDVSCILFPYTFEGRASVWYHNLPPNSIHNWRVLRNCS